MAISFISASRHHRPNDLTRRRGSARRSHAALNRVISYAHRIEPSHMRITHRLIHLENPNNTVQNLALRHDQTMFSLAASGSRQVECKHTCPRECARMMSAEYDLNSAESCLNRAWSPSRPHCRMTCKRGADIVNAWTRRNCRMCKSTRGDFNKRKTIDPTRKRSNDTTRAARVVCSTPSTPL